MCVVVSPKPCLNAINQPLDGHQAFDRTEFMYATDRLSSRILLSCTQEIAPGVNEKLFRRDTVRGLTDVAELIASTFPHVLDSEPLAIVFTRILK